MNIAALLLAEYDKLASACDALAFPSAAFVYNPLVYAREPFRVYLERFARSTRVVLMLGMNPGPFGMTQTGIPFGAVPAVRDWMGIQANVGQPPRIHPKRPVQGFECQRVEASGKRLWGFFAESYPNPEDFFDRALVLNYCPLVFMDENGANVTPDKLGKDERQHLYAICDLCLARIIKLVSPRALVGIGGFARTRLEIAMQLPEAAQSEGTGVVPLFAITHPSPANPKANRGWGADVQATLEKNELWPL